MQIPEHLLPLFQQLMALSETDRRLVIAAAEEQRELPAMSWETFDRARGIVSLGGDAVEDCKALYDGDYASAPVKPDEFASDGEHLGWDAEGWDNVK
jgi:hypothetical protein